MDTCYESGNTLEDNHTWEMVDLLLGKKPIGSNWVYKIKYKASGEVERYKARLVAKGYNQKERLNYHDTFSPVAKMVTVRTVISIAASQGWKMLQMDVNNAFLQGDLYEEVYMSLPLGFAVQGENKKDAAMVIILVYVHDLLITGNDEAMIQGAKETLQQHFKMKDLGNLSGAKTVSTPLEVSTKLTSTEYDQQLGVTDDPELEDVTRYQQLVGKLLYLTTTRPAICFGVQVLSQFMQHPKVSHWEAALRMVRYLKKSPGLGFMFTRGNISKVKAYCDANWAACPNTRRSVTGYAIKLGESLVSWKSKKQQTINRSSAESGYRSMAAVVAELIWLTGLLQDLGIEVERPITVYCDSKAAIQIAENPIYHERTKHIEIDCHFIREKVKTGMIKPTYVRTGMQLADILTKGLGTEQHQLLLTKLGVEHAEKFGYGVVDRFVGHGIGTVFHSEPLIFHHRNDKSGFMVEGQTFTIEPILTLGSTECVTWEDNWTTLTADGSPAAQFEHTILITKTGAEILTTY
ncbi:Methionine aminopeptidase 1B, chloroplastic [Capsicum annuum]|nr:Methionine aminopeptidase 1B, chloroplastic [Capsicum annuum]